MRSLPGSAPVVITGVGLVTGLGGSADETFRRLCAGERAIAPITLFDTAAQRCRVGAQIPDLDVASIAPEGQELRWSRTDAMALLAAREALSQARLDPRIAPVGLLVGGSTAGMFESEQLLAALHTASPGESPDFRLFRHPLASTADRLRETLGPFLRTRTLCSACSGGANAILLGALWLRLGLAERVLVGASEGLCRLTFSGFDALSITDPEGCRPFDLERRGMNLGEGAAFLVLETARSAFARQIKPIAALAGWACGAEATHITQPEEDGATVAGLLRRALQRAQLAPGDLDFISAHGTGTPRNDLAESAAIRDVFGALKAPWVSSHKGQLGHTLSSAGAIGAVLATLAIRDGKIPPTGGLTTPDPDCALRHVLGSGIPAMVRAAAVHAFGFGGLDTVLVLQAPVQGGTDEQHRGKELSSPASRMEMGELSPRSVVVTASTSLAPNGALSQALGGLDPDRTRRLDHYSRVVTASLRWMIEPGPALAPAAFGAIAGSAFGGVAVCAEHCARTEKARGRCTNPIQFPNLVPSSPVASAAIDLGLRGPVLAAADLGISGEVAAMTAIELLRADEAEGMGVVAFAEASPIIERVFDPLFFGERGQPLREGVVSFLFEQEESARARGAHALARIIFHEHGNGSLPALPPPPAARQGEGGRGGEVSPGALVVPSCEGALSLLAGTGWNEVRVSLLDPGEIAHEAAGACALVKAVALLAAGAAEQCLVLGQGPDRWSVFVLEALSSGAAQSESQSS